MKDTIIEGYKKKWLLEQIVNADSRISVCVNTIYNLVLYGLIKEFDRRLVKRYRKRSARKYRALNRNKSKMVLKRSIEQRTSVVINKRERLGDWEIDCVLPSREGKKCIVILTERKSRYTFSCIERNYHKKVYVTHAYAPQERGPNENTNGLIRAYLPKKTDV